MHGITLTKSPGDWEILQHKDGYAKVILEGIYNVHPAAIEVGVDFARPVVRVMREDDNMTVIPWTKADTVREGENYTGEFRTSLLLPAGGLYRIETSLETKSTMPDLTWLYRGDCVLHLGVGNLFIIAGQSNSAGYGRDYAFDPPHLKVHLYRNRGVWDLATHPMNESTGAGSLPNEEMGVSGVSPYLSFAKNFYELTRMPVGLIQTSLGGSEISRWSPEDGELYQNMINKIHATGGSYAGVLWYQGCSDTDSEKAPLYLHRFRRIVESLRQELGYEIPFFTCQINRQINGINDEAWGMVKEAQRQAALIIPGVTALSTTNLSLCDGIHNTAHSNMMLGEKLARHCYHVLNGGEEFEPPTVTQITHLDKKLELTFDHVKRGFLVFSGLGADSGFTLIDEKGDIEILKIRGNRQDENHIYLELSREMEGDAFLSFAWEADPVKIPFVDEVTYLPPLSFYKRKL